VSDALARALTNGTRLATSCEMIWSATPDRGSPIPAATSATGGSGIADICGEDPGAFRANL
jgi:hypothetical protein